MNLGQTRRTYSREQFPIKLYALLESADSQSMLCSGCTWLHHGRAFKIYDEIQFMKCVPKYFKQTKIRSFYRQLNLWGFKRVTKSEDSGAWYHEHFLRGCPEKMMDMVRIKIKSEASQNTSREEPDFSKLPPLPRPNRSVNSTSFCMPCSDARGDSVMDLTGNLPEPESRFNDNVATSSGEPDLTMPTPITPQRRVSSPSIDSLDDTTSHSLNSLNHGLQFPTLKLEDEAKKRLISRLKPLLLPFHVVPIMEPLPIESDIEEDDFAHYIDDIIEVL